MAAYITVGAKTTHGGTVITGSPQTTHYGIPIARQGDKVVCKKCKKVVTIITGDPSYIVDGAPVARAGDMTSCGSKLIASQQAFSESGFDVGSIAQAEPLQFAKSNMNDSRVKDNEEEPEELLFTFEVIELNEELDAMVRFNNELDAIAHGEDRGLSNLTAGPGGGGSGNSNQPWYEQDNPTKAMLSESYNGTVEYLKRYWGGAEDKGREFVNNTVNAAKHTKNSMVMTLGIIESGLKDFPQRTKASAATAMLQFGQRSNVDFVYIGGGMGVKHFGLDIGMSVNIHNGKVYEPVAANASVNTNKAPSIFAQVGVGRIISSNIKDDANATDAILSGQGHSYSIEVGPVTAAIETTQDGKTVIGSGGLSKSLTFKAPNGGSSVGASKGSTNMELAKGMKYNAAKNIIRYTGK